MNTLFILGAGASVDSGLPTYRGTDAEPEKYLSATGPLDQVWEFLRPLYELIARESPGPTYQLLKRFQSSTILTQNVDGYADSTGLPVIELHGNWKTMRCCRCQQVKETDLDQRDCSCGGTFRPEIILYGEALDAKKSAEVRTLINRGLKEVIVVGTSLQFGYLKNYIARAKMKGAKIIHINPDPDYQPLVGRNEVWMQTTAAEGLELYLDSHGRV